MRLPPRSLDQSLTHPQGDRTLFMINCKTGKDISAYSAITQEKEVGRAGRLRDEMSVGTKVNARTMVGTSARAGGRVVEVAERVGTVRECEDEVRWWLRQN